MIFIFILRIKSAHLKIKAMKSVIAKSKNLYTFCFKANGAQLLSVNTLPEHNFIGQWLLNNDVSAYVVWICLKSSRIIKYYLRSFIEKGARSWMHGKQWLILKIKIVLKCTGIAGSQVELCTTWRTMTSDGRGTGPKSIWVAPCGSMRTKWINPGDKLCILMEVSVRNMNYHRNNLFV